MSIRIASHLIFWLLYVTLLSTLFLIRLDIYDTVIVVTGLVCLHAGLFYSNYHWIVPSYYLDRKVWQYWLIVLGLVVVVILCNRFLFQTYLGFDQTNFRPPILQNSPGTSFPGKAFGSVKFVPLTFPAIIIVLLSLVLRISTHLRTQDQEKEQLRSAQNDAELKLLRSQINPHFLFNSLNNVYSLAVNEAKETPDMILKLSAMLRYVLYESNVDQVALSKEVDYLQSFVDLQKLKDHELQQVNTRFRPASFQIAPMLLIPFVENAFKHSESLPSEDIKVDIDMNCSDDGKFDFTVVNSVNTTKPSPNVMGGIVIENVKRRLALLYPDRHSLEFKGHLSEYRVQLQIQLT
ncbi:MAG: sensor histidine kinase [Bacteroidota bacterium]